MLSVVHDEMHGPMMAVGAIAQPSSGEDLQAVAPARYDHLSPHLLCDLSERIGKEWTIFMRGRPLFKHPVNRSITWW